MCNDRRTCSVRWGRSHSGTAAHHQGKPRDKRDDEKQPPGSPPPSHRPAEVPTAACAARAGRPAEWRERRHLPLPLPRTPRRHGLVQRLGEPPSHPSAIPTASSTLSPTSGGPGHQASTTPSPGVFTSGDGHALCVTSTQGQLSIPTARAPTLSIPVRLAPSAVHARFHNELLTMDFPSAFCNKNGVPYDYEFATRVETIPFRTLIILGECSKRNCAPLRS